MEKLTQKWTIIIPLEPVEDGAEFYFTDYPLHITLASVFATRLTGDDLSVKLSNLLENQKQFEVTAEEKDSFGPNKEVAVMKIHKSAELMQLYNLVYQALLNESAIFNEPQYEGNSYIPHSTNQKRVYLNVGDKVSIDSVSIVDLFPNDDGYMRKIVKTIKLN